MAGKERKERRFYRPTAVECCCSNPEECKECNIPGITINTSRSGMCVYTVAYFKEGTHLDVECKINGTTIKNARVKWCKELVDKEIYKIGLSTD
jgi:hypothetical protein